MLQQYARHLTDKVVDALNVGAMAMVNLNQTLLTPDFILIGLLEQEDSPIAKYFQDYYGEEKDLARQALEKIYDAQSVESKFQGGPVRHIQLSKETELCFEQAKEEADKFGDKYIGAGAMFLALLAPRMGRTAQILQDLGFQYGKVRSELESMRGGSTITEKNAEGKFQALNEYTTDLTELARRGELDPVIGREKEIKRIIQILSRRKKNNPVLIGEPGVGKTVIVEGLAQKIVKSEVPNSLLNKRVRSLEMSEVIAGAKMRGEFEERMKTIKDEVIAAQGNIILFIDELHTIVSAGAGAGGVDASNILKAALSKGQLQCIGATTLDEYKKHIEEDKALERRFQPIIVAEPTVEETVEILRGLQPKYEAHHSIEYRQEALQAAALLSEKYISDRSLPDKAVDLVDEAGSLKHLDLIYVPEEIRSLESRKSELTLEQKSAFESQNFEEVARFRQELLDLDKNLSEKKEVWKSELEKIDVGVTEEDIAKVVATWTGIPVDKIREGEAEKLACMEENLHKRLVGQNDAVAAISNAIRRNRAGLKDKNKPIGTFLFLGPTGVGKTELAKALAEFLLDDENRIIRLDMSEYMEKHSASKIIGSPPGYVGYDEAGQLTEKIRRRPYSVILLDELEKAHPDVFNILLQMFDDGRLTDSHGREVSFKNAIIIGTSNLGGKQLSQDKQEIGFSTRPGREYKEVKNLVLGEARKFFKPEFLNRLDDVIVFHSLSREEIVKIADLTIFNLNKRLKEKKLEIEVSTEVRDKLAEEGYSPIYGARPLKRLIESEIENPLSLKIINGEFDFGDKILVDLADGEIDFKKAG